jgi:hypothetical protein
LKLQTIISIHRYRNAGVEGSSLVLWRVAERYFVDEAAYSS